MLDVLQVIDKLKVEYGEVSTDLVYEKDWQLLVAVMLSAQTTDINVNKVTAKLFKKYQSILKIANSDIAELEKDVYSTGYYKSKAKNLKAMAQMVIVEYKGEIPQDFNELVKLPGVGRKTANVVTAVLWNNQDGVVVDTHVARISYRMGLTTRNDNAVKIEQELNKIVPKEEWENYTLLLINHGRKYCKARKPDCKNCPVSGICPKVGV